MCLTQPPMTGSYWHVLGLQTYACAKRLAAVFTLPFYVLAAHLRLPGPSCPTA